VQLTVRFDDPSVYPDDIQLTVEESCVNLFHAAVIYKKTRAKNSFAVFT
jgi:hypothetical protein